MAKWQPAAKRRPEAAQRPSAGGLDPARADHSLITWRLARLDFDGSWGWSRLRVDHLPNLHQTLVHYEGTPRRKLELNRRIQVIPVEDLCDEARQRLDDVQQSDVEQLWELRLGVGKWRVWGILDGAQFHLLWWDPDHTVCRGVDRAKRRSRNR